MQRLAIRPRPVFALASIIRRVAALVGLLAVVSAAWPAGAQQWEAIPSPFGVVEAYYRPADARDLGAGWERIIFEWPRFQPDGPHQYNLDAVPEAWLREARDAGREVVGLLKNTPLWASEIKMLGAPPLGLDRPIDDPANYWAAFVRRTVAYYGERWGIHRWIIYNEPDIRPGDLPWYEFDGTEADYYQMLKVAYLAARSVDPQAKIHLAGMAWWVDVVNGREPYLKRVLDIAAKDPDAYTHGFFFDVATVHVYFEPRNVWRLVVEMRGILEHYRLGYKPIWIGETNASPSIDPHAALPPSAYSVSLEQQAAYIVQASALALAAGAERIAVYRLYDDNYRPGETEPWGLVRADGSRRPAFEAYRMVIDAFGHTLSAQRYLSARSTMVTLRQPGRTVYVVWAREREPVRFHVFSLFAGETGLLYRPNGQVGSIRSEIVPGHEAAWYVVDTPGAIAQPDGAILVEGAPAVLVIGGPPRAVWIEVGGVTWQLSKGEA